MPRRDGPIVLPVPPSANRWWRVVHGRAVKSKAAREYRGVVVGALGSPKVRFPKPLAIRVDVYWYRARRSGDLDKRLGVLLDALQGLLYQNDSQIVELHAYRMEDPARPRVEVMVNRTTARRSSFGTALSRRAAGAGSEQRVGMVTATSGKARSSYQRTACCT